MLPPFNRKKQSRKPLILVVVMSATTLFVVWIGMSQVRQYRVAVLPTTYDIAVLSFASKQSLIKKIQTLILERDATNGIAVENAILRAENQSLRTELGRPSAPAVGTIARAITSLGRSPYSTIVLDAGSTEGVTVGQVAYAFGGVALGTISDVASHQSTVHLFSAPGRHTEAVLSSGSINRNVTLIGRGGGEYEIELSRDTVVAVGEVVGTQQVESAPIAVIQKVMSAPQDPFQRVFAKIPVSIETISWARIY